MATSSRPTTKGAGALETFETLSGEISVSRDEERVALTSAVESSPAVTVSMSPSTARRLAEALYRAADGEEIGPVADAEQTVWYSARDGGLGYVVFEKQDADDGRYRVLKLVDEDGKPAQGAVHTYPNGSLALIEFGPDEDAPQEIPFVAPTHWQKD